MPLIIVRNDITKMPVDAIVNAANRTLLGGGGVDGAIHRAAGPELLAECSRLGGCETGDAKITKGYRLPCRYVIHTVGPIWRDGGQGEETLLRSCYLRSLALAKLHGCRSVAFPLISSGVYGYPKAEALQVAVDTVSQFLAEHEMDVYIVVYDRVALRACSRFSSDIAAYIDDHYVEANTFFERRRPIMAEYAPMAAAKSLEPITPKATALEEMLKQADAGFTETLLKLIDQSGKKDAEIYKRANLSKQHFSKIRNNPYYKPSKPTAIALALALELDLEKTKDLIGRAGYALTNSSKFDLIIRYFIEQGNYNVVEINIALYEFDQSLLGGKE